MVGEGICRRAYWQAHVQCSDARDLSAPLTLQRGDHSATQAQSLDSSPFLCHVVESSHASALGGILALKNEYIVAWAWLAAWRRKRKRNSTFFKNMGYRGQSCDDWISLMRSFGD